MSSRGRRDECGGCRSLTLTPASKLWSLSAMPHVPTAAHCLVRDQTKQKLELVVLRNRNFCLLLFPPREFPLRCLCRPRPATANHGQELWPCRRSILRACTRPPHNLCAQDALLERGPSSAMAMERSAQHTRHSRYQQLAKFKGRPSQASSPPGIAHFPIEHARPPHSASSHFGRLPLALTAPELLVASRPLKVASRRRSRK